MNTRRPEPQPAHPPKGGATEAARPASDGGPVRISLRFVYPGGFMIGPGKADLLDLIGRTGSISAAGRAMGMSYKRAWSLVEVMNAAFQLPLVESARGGVGGGGAVLTAEGQAVLAHYRAAVATTATAAAGDIAGIGRRLVAPEAAAPDKPTS